MTTFLNCEFDVARHELTRDGKVVSIQPQVFEVLAYLIEHRERMVPKIELLDVIWGDRFVSESALTSRIKSARQAVGDDGRAQRIIKTVHGRGYRFVAEITQDSAAPGVAEPPLLDHLTFLFTDIEASSAAWERDPTVMNQALTTHDQILAGVIRSANGRMFKHTGDGVCAAFRSPADAIGAALTMQRRLQSQTWQGGNRPLVRIGVHSGAAFPRGDDYFGPGVNQAARVLDVANGDQIVVSASLIDEVPAEVDLTQRTEIRLIGLAEALPVAQITARDLLEDPRPLRIDSGGAPRETTALALETLEAGKGLAISLLGKSGAARTEAMHEVLEGARMRGFLVGRGSSAASGFRPLGGIIDALDELTQLAPNLLEELPPACTAELSGCIAGDPPTTRARLYLAVRELLVAAAASAPTLLVLDDAHLGSDGNLPLLREIAALAKRRPLGLVVAHRSDVGLGPDFQTIELHDDPAEEGEVIDPATLPGDVTQALAKVALIGDWFDLLDFQAATDSDPTSARQLLDEAMAHGAIEFANDAYHFADGRLAHRLVEPMSAHQQLTVRLQTAEQLASRNASPARVAQHYIAAGDISRAVQPAIEAAQAGLDTHSYDETHRWVDATISAATPQQAFQLQTLKADALAAAGDIRAVAGYRRLVEQAPQDELPALRTKLARAAMLSGDIETARENLQGLEPTGGPADGPILLAQGMLAYFDGDLKQAEQAVIGAREIALTPGAPARLLDAISLQGLISHSTGEWFDRLHREMRSSQGSTDLLSTVFDAHLCVAEYMLYGPTPYDEVIEMARSLRDTATAAGARPAAAFAAAVAGEAALLSGDLDGAREDLEQALALHHEMGAITGEAHTLQRIAELELVSGNRSEAQKLARRALTTGRWSPLANHLVQRAYGTLITASSSTEEALETAREVVEAIDEPTFCELCDIMVYVPLTTAFAESGNLDEARWALARAEQSATFWEGSAWPAAIDEAKSCIATSEGRTAEAEALLHRATRLFSEAGQHLDAARCREAVEAMSTDADHGTHPIDRESNA